MTSSSAQLAPARRGEPAWRESLAACARPRLGRGLLDIVTSVIPYLGLSVLMYFAIGVSWALTLALAIPTAGFAVRSFILFHDCAHGSFLPTRRANAWLGASLGVLLFTPFVAWRHDHAIHHATSGDLDRRGGGDVWTLTVAEYAAMSPTQRLKYRVFRSPLVMFGLGPIVAMIIAPRFVSRTAPVRLRRSVLGTDTALVVIVGALCWLIGWRDYLLVWGPTVWLAGAAGIWLFYVQHQFEDAYWESKPSWDYADAALRGSSHLRLSKVLQFFTGNIGLHHVHHLNARVPNYNLQRAHDENPVFHGVPTITLRDGFKAVRLKLWDEDRQRMVSFSDAGHPVFAGTR